QLERVAMALLCELIVRPACHDLDWALRQLRVGDDPAPRARREDVGLDLINLGGLHALCLEILDNLRNLGWINVGHDQLRPFSMQELREIVPDAPAPLDRDG